MPKRLIGFFHSEAIAARMLEVRQGLDPLFIADLAPIFSSSLQNHLALPPDQSYLVKATSESNTTHFIYKDPANLGDRVAMSAAFSGACNCCDASNAFYAIGGAASSILMVFRVSDGSLVPVSTSGLGAISSMDFSPDGAYLAVHHATSPYCRIYKTSDWSFINVATATPTSSAGCIFSGDSSKLLIHSQSSPCFSVYDPSTGVRSYSGNPAGAVPVTTGAGKTAARHPTDPNIVYVPIGSSPFICMWSFATNTATLFTAATPAFGIPGRVIVDPDLDADSLYVVHSVGSTSPSRTVTRFRMSTRTVYPDQPLVYRNVIFGYSGTPHEGRFVIISTTPHTISGTVRDVDNTPAARIVRAYRRSNGQLMAQTTSDDATGNYTLKLWDAGPYDVQFLTLDGELLNDLFYARAQPQAM